VSGYFMKRKTLKNIWRYAEDIRQRAYREYICSNRDREEQEIRERMARGVIRAELFQEKIEKRVMEVRRPKRGRPRK